jgi:signal transduction histidine kinase/CheY-like chemotaxis protein
MASILVVDHHPLARHFLATLLSYHGHQINEAADGQEALDAARKQRPDLIIADLALPRLDGVALIRALRSNPELGDIPVVLCTPAYREVESKAIARSADVEHVITRPSDPEVILETVQAALGWMAGSASHERRPLSSDSARQYIERLQWTSIRTNTLIELSLDLKSERDPDRLMFTACRAIRSIFNSRAAAIVLLDDAQQVTSWVDGAVEQVHLEPMFVREVAGVQSSVRNVSGGHDPLVQALTDAMPGVSAVLLLPMQSAGPSCGWILLGKTGADAAYSTDEERLALAAAREIHAAYETLVLHRAQRQHTANVSRDHIGLESRIEQHTSELRIANEALRREIAERQHIEEKLRSSHERLRSLSARILSIQEEERTRIARELHDDLAQLLTAIKIDASRLVKDVSSGASPPARVLEGLVPLIDTTFNAVGRIISELRPSRIVDMGLVAAIEKKLADFQQRTDIECELSIRPEDLRIPDDTAAAVFRILEEALTNIARHSGATRADVRLRQQTSDLLLEVRDNGRGIRDAERLGENAYGVIGMTERASLFGGTLTITGVEARGTIVAARIPMDRPRRTGQSGE